MNVVLKSLKYLCFQEIVTSINGSDAKAEAFKQFDDLAETNAYHGFFMFVWCVCGGGGSGIGCDMQEMSCTHEISSFESQLVKFSFKLIHFY